MMSSRRAPASTAESRCCGQPSVPARADWKNACGFPNFPQSGNQSPIRRGIDGLGSHDRTEMGDQGIYGTITDYMKFVWNRLI